MSDTVIDEMIRREVQLQRFATNIVRELINPTAQEISQRISAMLIGYEDLPKRDQTKMINDIKKYTSENWGSIWVGFEDNINGVMDDEGQFQADLYNDVAPEDYIPPAKFPPSNAIMAVGGVASTWSDFTNANASDAVRAINGVVLAGIRDGQTVSQITRELRGRYDKTTKRYKGGVITGRLAQRAETLARTGISHYVNGVRDRFAIENDDIIKKRVFFATLDSRTTTICLANHLKEWDIGDNSYPKLPLHYNERSVYVFKTDDFDPTQEQRPIEIGLGDGESDFETVKGTLTSSNWLKRQPRWFVEESLGKKRAELFLDGKLDIKNMVDMQNRPLTLEQLKQTTAGRKAFKKVNKDG